MKSKILMYLLVFSGLLNLFQLMNSNKVFESNTKRIVSLEKSVEKYKDSTQQLYLKTLDLQHFSLENNDDALAYYEDLSINNMEDYIADKLIETNEKKGDNPLVPYAGMNGDMKINKIMVLNHKWIIADFSDGKFWGELFLSYELKPDLGVDFTLENHLLYTRSN